MKEEIRNLVIADELTIGSNEDKFLLKFKGKMGKSEDEFTAMIPLDGLKEIVLALFQFGVEYQKTNNSEIGFGIYTEENDESRK